VARFGQITWPSPRLCVGVQQRFHHVRVTIFPLQALNFLNKPGVACIFRSDHCRGGSPDFASKTWNEEVVKQVSDQSDLIVAFDRYFIGRLWSGRTFDAFRDQFKQAKRQHNCER